MGLSLVRFLLLLVARLRRFVGRIVLVLRARFASLWGSILTPLSGQSQVRLHANDVPVIDHRPRPTGVEEEASGTLAALPVRRPARWQDEISRYQNFISSNHFKFDPHPATPDGGSQRYSSRPPISQSIEPPEIPIGQQKLLSSLPVLPDGWTRHVHPEGNVLFYHKGLRIFTESDIIHRGEEIIFYATTLVQLAIHTKDVIIDELTEIVLNVDGNQRWHYYFVDHKHRLLFWIHPVRPQDLGNDLRGISEYSHIRYLVEQQYWNLVYILKSRSHCEYYPHNRTLPEGVFEELGGMLNYAKTDMITTDSSSSPFTQDELAAISDLVRSIMDSGKTSNPCSVWVIARLMAFFTENQFLNFCGQPCARLNADTPLFGQQTWDRSNVFKAINAFLFGSLNDHAVRLQRVWVDGIVIQPRWKDFTNRLTSELGRYTIFSTVMLAVNFSFLAVPGVMPVSPAPKSPIVIIIYCSVVSTIGSIIFSFTLLNVYSDPRFMDADHAAEVMKILSQKKWGVVRFAITHSLPYACLIWSIILFAVALAIQIFSPKELPTAATLGVECLILVLFGMMTMRVMWLFSRDEADSADASAETSTESQDDVEQGCAKCWGR